MAKSDIPNPFYYTAPVIRPEDDEDYVDPLMDIPALDDKEARPGDLFRNAGSVFQDDAHLENPKLLTRFRAGKLNWPFSDH